MALSCVLFLSQFPQYGCRSQRHVWHSVSLSISLLQLVRQIIVKENLGLRKKKRERFQNSPSRRQGRQNNTYVKKLKARSSLMTTRSSKKEETRSRVRRKKREKEKKRKRERLREREQKVGVNVNSKRWESIVSDDCRSISFGGGFSKPVARCVERKCIWTGASFAVGLYKTKLHMYH